MDQAQFAIALLKYLGIELNSGTIDALMTWFRKEGGAGPEWGIPGNIASYNPLNTCLDLPGSEPTPGNTPPVRAYNSWAQGVQATGDTINQPNMAGIRTALDSGAGCTMLSAAVAASPWGTGSFADLCGPVSTEPAPPGVPAPNPQPQPSTGGTDVLVETLHLNSVAKPVRAVQLLLNDAAGARLAVDGVFGPATEGAVKAWQNFFRLSVDGIVGSITWGSLVAFA